MSTPTSRERIVAAAAAIASVEGVEALTLGRLSKETGISKSNVVERFGSLEDLRLATIEHAAQVFAREVVTPAEGHRPGQDRLLALTEGWLDYVRRGVFPGGCFLTRVAAEHAGRTGPIADAVRQQTTSWTQLLADQAKAGAMTSPSQLAYELVALGTPAVLETGQTARRRARTAIRARIAAKP